MSLGMFTRMDGSAGFPAAGLIVMGSLAVIRYENCAGSGFESKTDLAFDGRLSPRVEEIAGRGLGSVDRQSPDLSSRQCRNVKINCTAAGVKQEEQIGFPLSQNQTRKGFLPWVRPVRSIAVSREPLDIFIRIEFFFSQNGMGSTKRDH